LPLVPLSDGVGEIVERGSDVRDLEVGDRVCPIFAAGWLAGDVTKEKLATTRGGPLPGVLAESVLVPAETVVKPPAYLSDEEAATLPCAMLTAWSALVLQGGVTAGDTVLVEGTGGVSISALQIAKMIGARVVVTSSSDEKLERATALGADHGINYRTTAAWGREAKKLTGERGVDHVIEVGGAGTIGEALKAVRPGGTVSIIGVLSGGETKLSLLPVLMQNVRLQGVFVGHKEGFVAMNRAIEQHRPRPVVDRVFGFDEVRAAFEHMERGAQFGKIVVRIG
jgi:NADPH:quinone reductase-like Zn-dependent oxidoreductase